MRSDAGSVAYTSGYVPGVVGRMIEMHGLYYARAWGAGAVFETLMAREIGDFVQEYDPERELLLSASVDERIMGSIAILRPEPGEEGARLRWFLLDPGCQGRGIGSELLSRSLRFARSRYPTCYLWTVTGLPASMHMYEKVGFKPVKHEVDTRYGLELKSVRLDLDWKDLLLDRLAGTPAGSRRPPV